MTHESISDSADSENLMCYRSIGDVVYVVDKMAAVWPTYVPCVIVDLVSKTNDDDTVKYVVKPIDDNTLHLKDAFVKIAVDSGNNDNIQNNGNQKKSIALRRRKKSLLKKNFLETKSDSPPPSKLHSSSDEESSSDSSDADDEDEEEEEEEELLNVRRNSTMFNGSETLIMEEINILSGRQFSLEIGKLFLFQKI